MEALSSEFLWQVFCSDCSSSSRPPSVRGWPWVASWLSAWLEHRHLWLKRPMRERHCLLQRSHVYGDVSNLSVLSSCFLRALLSVAACVSFSSPDLRCLVSAPLHSSRLSARLSQDSVLMSTAFNSPFDDIASRYRSCDRPLGLFPEASSLFWLKVMDFTQQYLISFLG